ncbi:PREDICTED: peroxisome biogenesis factor 10 [Nicrophorus vespilloides]|uniref:RING-type E3 ubiquitin transferase n=1 Tax=Nicrophorus vespilloides TaxID=110193 RepID=A0ABM1MT83_NICVS|nr:PREDICTED: peroxisome biogenesis factor 10 [Nicrophorus vespilloides]XP_017777784.1 PREDICTED: peroxisome biogenesis factor 10 [Nicrophorus vespilloides]
MNLFPAEISDILRCNQRDVSFIKELEEYITDVLQSISRSRFHKIRQYIPISAQAWYYFLTSLGNYQTLGEEYTGTVRLSSGNEIPSKLSQTLWLVLFLGGEGLFDKALASFGKKIHFSDTLTPEAKGTLLKTVDFLKENKHIIIRLHQSIFYIFGTYHNISNRLSGMKYMLLREWMQDSSATTSFNILGKISLLYLVYLLVDSARSKQSATMRTSFVEEATMTSKTCVLCVESCKNTSCTPCGHIFCWSCIHDSLKYQPNCPFCREEVLPNRIILLQNY